MKNFATFEKHTKGFGLKMLQKMGYREGEGLGKDGRGISRPVEAAVRPAGVGLGAISESKKNQRIEAELHGKEFVDEAEESGSSKRSRRLKQSEAEKLADQKQWRRQPSTAKPKRKFQTVAEILAKQRGTGGDGDDDGDEDEDEVGRPAVTKVLDMRGPETRVLSSLDEVGAEGPREGEPVLLGQEFLHNLNLHLDLSRTNVQSADRRKSTEQQRLKLLQGDAASLGERVNAGKAQLQRFRDFEALLGRLEGRVDSASGSLRPDEVLQMFQELGARKYAQEFAMFGVAQVAPAVVTPVLKQQMASWSPLNDPDMAIDLLTQWQPLLIDPSVANPVLRRQNSIAFDLLAEQLVVRRLQEALTNDWDVYDAGPCLRLIEGLKGKGTRRQVALISDGAMADLLQVVIYPKLKRAVEAWSPSDDSRNAGRWFTPWLSHLPQELADLMPSIRRKLVQFLASALGGGGTEHASRYQQIVAPWLEYFEGKARDSLVTQIAGCLALQLRSVEINPQNQTIESTDIMESVLSWQKLLPEPHLSCLLRGEFFPKWKRILFQWVRVTESEANESLVIWYRGWKDFIFKHIDPDPWLRAEFGHALDLMYQGRKLSKKDFEALRPASADEVSYQTVFQDYLSHAAQARRPPPEEPEPAPAESATGLSSGSVKSSETLIAFKDVVDAFAQEQGVPFMIKNRMHDGKQLYSFGGITIYLDMDVAHVERTKGSWGAISLEDLHVMVQQRSASK